MKKSAPFQILENIEILDAGAEGMSVARSGDLVIFIPFGAPGDVADIRVLRKKKNFAEGRIERLKVPSPLRAEPFCDHFGICGGCKWQHLEYESQVKFKQKQVTDSFQRIGKIPDPPVLPILASPKTREYRNKLEFTFSTHRWWTGKEPAVPENTTDPGALGFHIPGFFDKVLDIGHCSLQAEPSNRIRNFLRDYALQHGIPFYNIRKWEGHLRNLIIRTTMSGELMLILVVREDIPEINEPMLEALKKNFPEITSLYYVINAKKNDSVADLEFRHYTGALYMTEVFPSFQPGSPDVTFRIGPASFFQTNSLQALNLYRRTAEMAGFSGDESVFDLYTGTGTIACYIARSVKRVTGIESVQAAVEDARTNARLNGIGNVTFHAGEAEHILTPGFIRSHGGCDILITDPPRAGMHEKVIRTILESTPGKIVYVSCNPSTQARDVALLSEIYRVSSLQPVDMFPHTQHVENIALLEKVSP